MKKNTLKTAALIAVTFTFGLTACKKEPILPKKENKSPLETSIMAKGPIYTEGILSNNGYSGMDNVVVGYYQFSGPTPGQQPAGVYQVSNDIGSGAVIGCGATTGQYVYAFKSSTGVQFLDGPSFTNTPIFDLSGNTFTPLIEEIEIHPQTLQIYALVTEGNSKRIYAIDRTTGVATPMTVNGGLAIFQQSGTKGYKCGSITFIPDNNGGYELVFTSESTFYAALGVVSWYFSISGTNLTSLPKTRTYAGIPGTVGSGINTTYGNGKLYFTRERMAVILPNSLYSLDYTTPLVGSATASSFAYEGFGIENRNDFGYFKAY